jgi:hypothetical protein
MRRRRRWSTPQIFGIVVFAIVVLLAFARQRPQNEWTPRARYSDATPLGGKGLRLLMGRLNYRSALQNEPVQAMPRDAKVWFLLDPAAYFSQREAKLLWRWIEGGGTLVFADTSPSRRTQIDSKAAQSQALRWLREKLKVQAGSDDRVYAPRAGELLPELAPLQAGAASVYWSGVQKVSASGWPVEIRGPAIEIAGAVGGAQLARVDVGRGRVFVMADALLFTNYALSKPDNAVFVTNLIRAHAPPGSGTVYFDERQHMENEQPKVTPNLLYFLWRPPLRWALLQLLGAALLWWALASRRLGTPVGIPDHGPVTRASQFAIAMGQLFHKAGRPRAAAVTVGENFRRSLTRHLGMSPTDGDIEISRRAATATGLPIALIDRLLLRAAAPAENEAEMLSDAQEMELVLRRLDASRY